MRRVGFLAAVSVPAGVSEVTIDYQPPGLIAGAVVSVLAIIGCGVVVVRDRRRRGEFVAARPDGSRAVDAEVQPR